MGWMDDAMVELRPWIGRVRTVEDDIGMMAVRRVAATFDVDPDSIKPGDRLPPHWFTVFFAETIVQAELGPDGHPNKGIVLPPIPMPRRMGAGRRVQIMNRLRAGVPAVKKAEVTDIVPKSGRSGDIFVLTMRHTIEQEGKTLKHGRGELSGLTARLVHPLWVGQLIDVRGEEQKDGNMKIWASNKDGVLCGEMDLEFSGELTS